MDFDDFDWKDATTFGGIAGFIEDCLREENRRDPSEPSEDEKFDEVKDEEEILSLKRQLQMLAAQNPELAKYVVRKAREHSEQWALQAQAKRLISAAEKAYKLQEEEDQKGSLSSETMSDALTKWSEYKWALLGEKEYVEYPELYALGEAISENWNLKLDYLKPDGYWEEGLVIQPKRFAKYRNKVYIHGYCEQWKKQWFFKMDLIKSIKVFPMNDRIKPQHT